MTAPLYTGHGHTIPDPADGYLTNDEINDEIDGIRDIPRPERTAFFNAVRHHHDHQHFVVDPDNVFMTLATDGSIILKSIVADVSSIPGREGQDVLH